MNDSTKERQTNGNGGAKAGNGNQPQFLLRQLYIKDFSFEAPNTPGIFSTPAAGEPDVKLNLKNAHNALGEDLHEVVLHLSVDAQVGGRSLFLVELDQAGVFQVSGYPAEDMRKLLGIHCPTTLFPYAREAISSMVAKGGFPPLVLQPISFEALYAQANPGGATLQA